MYIVYRNTHLNVVWKYSNDEGETWTGPFAIGDSLHAGEPTMTTLTLDLVDDRFVGLSGFQLVFAWLRPACPIQQCL